MRQDLINKLADPSIVGRYEHNHSHSESEFPSHDLRLSFHEAMELQLQLEPELTAPPTTDTCSTSTHTDTASSTPLDASVPVPASSSSMYPPWNYLTLRHAQNTSWAQSQFDRGVSYAKAALHQSCENSMALIKKAEVCYKEGLEMIPHHIQILTAYGALCINDGRLEMARDLLDKAIQYATQRDMNDALAADANIVLNHEGIGKSSGGKGENKASSMNQTLEDAKTYLSVVEGKLRGREQMEQASKKKGQHMALSNKAEQAMNDALAERAFSVGDDPKKVSVSGAKSHGNYELLSSSEDNEQEEDNESLHKRKKKDSHRKKKRRRRESKHRRRRDRSESRRRRKKRQRYDSSSSDHESGGDDSESRGSDASYTSDSRDRKRKKHRKKVSKSKRRSNTSR